MTVASDVTIQSHRGGLNEDPQNALRDDELVTANNIELWTALLGERRLGCAALDLTSSGLDSKDEICFLSQWFPTNIPTVVEFLAAAVTLTSSIVFARRDTAGTWHAVTASDTVDKTAPFAFRMQTQPFSSHVHWAYKSDQTRSHIYESGGTMRRSGIAAPATPTAANTATGGKFQGTRYYRQRSVTVVGSVVTVRSEPSAELTFTPSGSKNGVTVTKGADQSGEASTHWELEASLDDNNWYRIVRTINATTTYDDHTSGRNTYPSSPPGAPSSTDGTSITYVLLSDQAAQLNLTGTVSNGVYSNGTDIAGRGWIGYTSAGVYIPLSTSMAWSVNSAWFASPDVATEMEKQASGGTGQDYADVGTLSEAVGAYLTLPSFKYCIVDGDRLVYGGDQSNSTFFSRVGWTPPTADPGVGNDERAPIVTTGGTDITTTLQLDNFDGGGLTGLAPSILGTWFAFKWQRIYAAQRTRNDIKAYEIDLLTPSRGAIDGSVVQATDAKGNSVTYFLDPNVGPCQLTPGGVVKTIRGLTNSWPRVNVKATNVVACGTYYPRKGQVMWALSVDGGNTPSFGVMIDTNYLRSDEEDGYLRGGITLFDGKKAAAFCMATLTYTDGNLTTDIPFVGTTNANGGILRTDATGVYKDNGTSFTARVLGKPRYTAGLMRQWEAMKVGGLFTALTAGAVRLGLVRDQGATGDSTSISPSQLLAPVRTEPQVLAVINDVHVSEASSIQILITDGDTADADKPWNCQRVDFTPAVDGDA